MNIEIVSIQDLGHRFMVEFEIIETRERKQHGFPKNEGWELEDSKGKPKFIKKIEELMEKEQEKKNNTSQVQELSNKYKGYKINISDN